MRAGRTPQRADKSRLVACGFKARKSAGDGWQTRIAAVLRQFIEQHPLLSSPLEVFRSVTGAPGSITAIAGRLHRNRRAFKSDVFQLLQAGLVAMKTWMLAGRGHTKETRAATGVMRLEALVM